MKHITNACSECSRVATISTDCASWACRHCGRIQQTRCNTCGKPASAPYRRHDMSTGKITEGCVDDFHTGHLVTPSESSYWHNRKDAKTIRAAAKKHTGQYLLA